MRVQVIDNVSRKMETVLCPLIEDSTDLRVAVAFMSDRGLAIIRPSVTAAIRAGATVEFLVGLDMRTTEPEALRAVLDMTSDSEKVAMYCYAGLTGVGTYHPKLYLSRMPDVATFIVGSSNLTEGGLKRNVEINVLIEADIRDELVSDIHTAYNRLKFHPERVIPDGEFITLYAELRDRERATEQSAGRDTSIRALRRTFREKAASLRRPVPSRRDLVGWLEMVYDAAPDGEFTNELLYRREGEFRLRYPGNLNIKAKIRQQLQVLRDMGFVEDVAPGRWRKL